MFSRFCTARFKVLFSTVRCSGAGKQFDRVAVVRVFFLNGGVFERNVAHRRTVVVLYMLIKLGV